MIIAVDGPTASGKGTIALALAGHFDLPYLDTGLLYRAVGWQVRLHGGDPDSEADALAGCEFPLDLLEEPELRSETIGGFASRVSVHPAVRRALYDRQRGFALRPGGAVLDGRDIGTVIAPEAPVKLFVTASVEARARRRFQEMIEAGYAAELSDITADLAARDQRDKARSTAPLRAADDATVLDTSELDVNQAIARAIALVTERMEALRG
jgi:cytidylate kinase